METKNKARENISIVKAQIASFDNKANILIAIVGIIFAVSLGVFDAFKSINISEASEQMKVKYGWLIALCIIYFISFSCEMVLLLSVIFPRKKKYNKRLEMSYYYDVAKLNHEEIKSNLIEDNEEYVIDQLLINSKICVKKHNFLVAAVWTMIPLFASMFALFFVSILY